MGRYRIKQLVWSPKHNDMGLIINEDKEKDGYWSVVMRNKLNKNTLIRLVHQEDLTPYRNYCWNCLEELDSDFDSTCEVCGWLICPECKVCKKPKCESNGVTLSTDYNEE